MRCSPHAVASHEMRCHTSAGVAKRAAPALALAGFLFALFAGCNRPTNDVRLPHVHRGNLVAASNVDFDYVEGDLIDCKNVSVAYLKGDVLGRKSRGIHVSAMRGNVVAGQAKIGVLDGNIVDGTSVSVRVLIGEDLSGKAEVLDRSASVRTNF